MIYKCRNINCKREFDKASQRNQHEKDSHKTEQIKEKTMKPLTKWFDGSKEVPFHNGKYEFKKSGTGNFRILKVDIVDGKTAEIKRFVPLWGVGSDVDWLSVGTEPKSIASYMWRGLAQNPEG